MTFACVDVRNLRQAALDIQRTGRTALDIPGLLLGAALDLESTADELKAVRFELWKTSQDERNIAPTALHVPLSAHAATDG